MRVLLTGMTSAQCNPDAHRKTGNYPGYLAQALRDAGHEVDHRDPMIDDPLDGYDHVIVGIVPLGSLGANRCYGALDTISHSIGDERLTLLVDAPDPEKIEVSLSHMLADPAKLFKPFFSYRKGYTQACELEVRDRLMRTVDHLANDTWPETITPSLPWTAWAAIEGRLPVGARERVRLVNVDPWVLDASSHTVDSTERPPYWSYEPSGWDKWLQHRHVSWDVVRVPRSHRVESDTDALRVIHESRGCLIAGTKRGLWWNTRFVQALAQDTPIFTDWFEAQHLSDAFSVLPANFEYDEDRDLAKLQRKAYLETGIDRDHSIETINKIIGR